MTFHKSVTIQFGGGPRLASAAARGPDLFEQTVEQLVAENQRYHREAYVFVRDALRLTVEAACESAQPNQTYEVHATALLDGLRGLAVKRFGPMAKIVLEEWGIRACQDFGEIIFNMAEAGFLARSAKGCQTAFVDGFDFEEAFRKPFLASRCLRNPGNPD